MCHLSPCPFSEKVLENTCVPLGERNVLDSPYQSLLPRSPPFREQNVQLLSPCSSGYPAKPPWLMGHTQPAPGICHQFLSEGWSSKAETPCTSQCPQSALNEHSVYRIPRLASTQGPVLGLGGERDEGSEGGGSPLPAPDLAWSSHLEMHFCSAAISGAHGWLGDRGRAYS